MHSGCMDCIILRYRLLNMTNSMELNPSGEATNCSVTQVFPNILRNTKAHYSSPSLISILKNKETPWSEPASELYRPSDSGLWANLVPTFADRGMSRSQRGGSPTTVISAF
jgi:hypothetical protein